jgi:hypothetical protein
MQMNQAPMNLTTAVVFGSSSLRLRWACLANAIAAVGRMTIQRPSDPNSRKKRPTSLLFVMVSVHSSQGRRWSFVVGRWLQTKDQRPRTGFNSTIQTDSFPTSNLLCDALRQLAVRQATLDSQFSLSNKAHCYRKKRKRDSGSF